MSRRAALDLAVITWVVAWLWLGVAVAQDIRGLRHLSDTVSSVGRAAQDTGRTLRTLGDLPLVGEDLRSSATSIEEAGRQAIESGRRSRKSIHRTSILLAISIALIPSATALFVYLPARLRWAAVPRGARRSSVAATGEDEGDERDGAQRAGGRQDDA